MTLDITDTETLPVEVAGESLARGRHLPQIRGGSSPRPPPILINFLIPGRKIVTKPPLCPGLPNVPTAASRHRRRW